MNNKKAIDFVFFIAQQMRDAGYIYTHTGPISACMDYCDGVVRGTMMPSHIMYAVSISETAHKEAKAAYDAAVRGPYDRDAHRAAAKHYQVCRAIRAIVRVVDYAMRGERGGFNHPWIGEEIAIAKASACIAIDADVRDDTRRAIAAYLAGAA